MLERNYSTLERTPATENTSIEAHAYSKHHHWRINAPVLDPTYLALERTSTSSTHSKGNKFRRFLPKIYFWSFL
jgi:hypothetical protein